MRIAIFAGVFLPAVLFSAQRVDLTSTEKTEFAPGGTVRIEASTGELNVEGWDESFVEVQSDRFTWSDREDRAKADLARVQISKQVSGNEMTITTTSKHFTNIRVNYRIRVPRSTKLVIHHGTGDVVVFGVDGDIDASAKVGDVMVQLREPARYAIDAVTKLGSVTSDFGGPIRHHRLGIGESINTPPEGAGDPRHLSLHITKVGGITIQKVSV